MSESGLENFASVVTVVAAFLGVVIAGIGLWTWKQQIRWEQGRGLAVGTLQSFFELKRTMLEVRKLGFPKYKKDQLEQIRIELAREAWRSATDYCERMNVKVQAFEKNTAAAFIVWDEDFQDVMGKVLDVEHIIRSAVLSAAAAINPEVAEHQRQQSSSAAQDFIADIYGTNEERHSIGDSLLEIQKVIEEKLKQKRLS